MSLFAIFAFVDSAYASAWVRPKSDNIFIANYYFKSHNNLASENLYFEYGLGYKIQFGGSYYHEISNNNFDATSIFIQKELFNKNNLVISFSEEYYKSSFYNNYKGIKPNIKMGYNFDNYWIDTNLSKDKCGNNALDNITFGRNLHNNERLILKYYNKNCDDKYKNFQISRLVNIKNNMFEFGYKLQNNNSEKANRSFFIGLWKKI